MIYFISNGQNIKIGVSELPRERLKELQTGSDKRLILLADVYTNVNNFIDDYAYEKYLHLKFRKYRLSGEWFAPNEKLLDLINSISKYYVDYDKIQNKINVYNKMAV